MKRAVAQLPWAWALTETLGEAEAQDVQRAWRKTAPDEPSLAALLAVLERRYGAPAGRGIAVRLGQALFRRLAQHGRSDLPWRLLPTSARVTQGLTWIVHEVTPRLGFCAEVQDQGVSRGWHIFGRWCHLPPEVPRPHASLWQGFFQEALYWLTGRVYPVFLEDAPAGKAVDCTLRVPPRPLY